MLASTNCYPAKNSYEPVCQGYNRRNGFHSLRKASDFDTKGRAAVFRQIFFKDAAICMYGGLSIPSVIGFFEGVWFDYSGLI